MRRKRWGKVLLVLLVPIAMVVGIGLLFLSQQRHIAHQDAQIQALAVAHDDEQVNAVNHGVQPVTPSAKDIASDATATTTIQIEKGEAGPAGPTGQTGAQGPGPTQAQVQTAVAAYLAAHPPEAGKNPTNEQVAAAVAMYCTANKGCRGADGAQGPQGVAISGPKGDTGPAGPPPSDEAVSNAVAAFCSDHGGCSGIQGPPGPQGAPGVPGAEPGSFTFTVGLTQYVCSDPDGDHAYTCASSLVGP